MVWRCGGFTRTISPATSSRAKAYRTTPCVIRRRCSCCWRALVRASPISPRPGGNACSDDPLRHHRRQDRTTSVPPVVHPVSDLAGGAKFSSPCCLASLAVRCPLVLLGQNSLSVFCSGIFFGFIARLALEANEGASMQFAVNAFGALAMVTVAGLAAWYRGKGRAGPVRQPVALQEAVRTDTG